MEFWNQDYECLSREEIAQLQLERLQATLNRVYKNVSHYRKTFLDIDLVPEDLRSLNDLKNLPFTSRRDLMDNYPYGMFAVPLREVVRIHAPAINYDNPVVVGFTSNDLKNWAELMARNLTSIGMDKDDVIQVSMTFGVMTGSFGIQLGAELTGASVIPMPIGKPGNQVRVLKDFRSSTLAATPTFALAMADAMRTLDIDPKDLTLKYGIFGAEPWSEDTRHKLEEGLQLSATDAYGLAEVFGPGVAWECQAKKGLHLYEDHFIPEIIDPLTMEVLPPGETGELVLTTISKAAFPLIRFRTGDLTRMTCDLCECGRTHCRIARIFKRCDDVLVMRGTSIMPEQIGRILSRIGDALPNYQLVVEQADDQALLTILIEISDRFFFDEMKKQRAFVDDLRRAISQFLGWEVSVKLVEPGTFDPNQKLRDYRQFE